MLTAAALLIGGAALLYILDRMIRDVEFGLRLILGVAFLRTVVEVPAVSIGGVDIHVADVLVAVLMAAVVAGVLRGWAPTAGQVGLALVLVAILFSIARGAQLGDAPAAVNEARVHLYLLATILYASQSLEDHRGVVVRAWSTYSWALIVVCVVRWAVVLGGLPGLGDWYQAGYGGLRVVGSADAMVLGLTFLMMLPKVLRGEASRRELQLAGAAGTAVLLLQHRSVIVMILLGAALQLLRNRRGISPAALYALGALCLVAAIGFATVGGGALPEQVGSADLAGTGTFEWRVEGWRVLLQEFWSEPWGTRLFGLPFGSGWRRVLGSGEVVDVTVHNMYVELVLRVGLVGLAGVMVVLGRVWWRLRRSDAGPGGPVLDNSTLSVVLVALAIYMVPYWLSFESGILIGVAVRAADQVGSQRPVRGILHEHAR